MSSNAHKTPYRGKMTDGQAYGGYQAMSRMAVLSLVFGISSLLTFWHGILAVLPVLGVMFGRLALSRIRDYPHELTGRRLAVAGIITSVLFGVLGCGYLIFAKAREVPFGYDELELQDLQPDPKVEGEKIPPRILAYGDEKNKDKKIFLRGYMDKVRQQSGLKIFVLCPSVADCPYCPSNPKPTEMLIVRLMGNLSASYSTHEIHVGGRLKIDPSFRLGTPYVLEADYLMQPR